ncbi:MAG: YjbQ family protein [Spirochaetes bacterium]|nr:YjbQ family protein [Spirochaetota bacterium]
MMNTFSVKTASKNQMKDITSEVIRIVKESGVNSGICVIYTPHTTAAITINENADPDVVTDMLTGFDSFHFEKLHFYHSEGNSPSHLKSSIVGCSETVIIEENSLLLGTWQGIYFCEFDGPRNRKVHVKIISE